MVKIWPGIVFADVLNMSVVCSATAHSEEALNMLLEFILLNVIMRSC